MQNWNERGRAVVNISLFENILLGAMTKHINPNKIRKQFYVEKTFYIGHLKKSRKPDSENFLCGPDQGGAYRRHWFGFLLIFDSIVPKTKLKDVKKTHKLFVFKYLQLRNQST